MDTKKREHGKEQPYLPFGIFKIRVPFVHYKLEKAEFIQAFIMFVVSVSMIPLLQQSLGLPYDVAMAYVFVCGIGFMLPALLGEPVVPGWITPAIPIVILYLSNYPAGPEAIKALVALQLLVTFIFLFLGITGLGAKLANNLPNSLKGGILIGAGIAALLGEIKEGGRLAETPISLTIGSFAAIYLLFSLSFKKLSANNKLARFLSNAGIVPALLIAIVIGWGVGEYKTPNIEWGINLPALGEMWNYLPFTVGFPDISLYIAAIPTAIIAYIIAYGDIVVGGALIDRASKDRDDELIDSNTNRIHIITGIRNLLHSFFAPYPGLAGPIWTAITATVSERYRNGRDAMDSIYGGAGTFWIAGFLALFMLPLVTIFQPVLSIALSLTLILTGYLCITIGIDQVKTEAERGVAGVMAVALAVYGAAPGLITGVILYIIIERTSIFKADQKAVEMAKAEEEIARAAKLTASDSEV
ncbi:MAG: solute carrier family 23 protein [Solibacillus sp.]